MFRCVVCAVGTTSTRQPLDCSLFGPAKKRYARYYFDQVYIKQEVMKQPDTISIFNHIFLTMQPSHIIKSFNDAMFNDAVTVIDEKDDPHPSASHNNTHDDEADEPQSDEIDCADSDDDDVESWHAVEAITQPLHTFRHPRTAHTHTADSNLARFHEQNHQ